MASQEYLFSSCFLGLHFRVFLRCIFQCNNNDIIAFKPDGVSSAEKRVSLEAINRWRTTAPSTSSFFLSVYYFSRLGAERPRTNA